MNILIQDLARKIKKDFAALPESYREELEPALSRYILSNEEPKFYSVKAMIWDAIKLAIAITNQPQKNFVTKN